MNEKQLLDYAVTLLAEWANAVETVGTGWDDWDYFYKKVRYRDNPLRELIDKKLKEIKEVQPPPPKE